MRTSSLAILQYPPANTLNLSNLCFYDQFFHSLTLLSLSLYLISFTHISRKLSQFYTIISSNPSALFLILVPLFLFYLLLALAAQQILGLYHSLFRTFPHTISSLLTVFTLHTYTDQLDPSVWLYFFLLLYVLFMHYFLLNGLLASIFFEHSRKCALYEEAIYFRYSHMRRRHIFK